MTTRISLGVTLAAGALTIATTVHAVCDSAQPTRTPTARYAIKGGDVYDKKTDLTWQRCSIGQRWEEGTGCVGIVAQMTWDEAMAKASDPKSSSQWRLPTRDELSTLISPTCRNPAINEESFPDLDLGKLWYWSSSESGEYLAWLANFADGQLANYDRSDVGAVRLVRSGP